MNCCKSTDIIGVVEDPGNVSDIRTRLGQRTVHSFTITDGLDSCNIKVWEDQQSSSNVLFNQNLDTRVCMWYWHACGFRLCYVRHCIFSIYLVHTIHCSDIILKQEQKCIKVKKILRWKFETIPSFNRYKHYVLVIWTLIMLGRLNSNPCRCILVTHFSNFFGLIVRKNINLNSWDSSLLPHPTNSYSCQSIISIAIQISIIV